MSITSPLRQHYSPLFSVSSYPPKPSLQLNTTLVLLFHMMTTISVSATTPHRFMLWFFPLFMAKITKVHMYENYFDGKIYLETGVIVWMGPVSVVTWAFTAFLPHAFILKEPTQPIPMIRMMKIFQTWLWEGSISCEHLPPQSSLKIKVINSAALCEREKDG